MAISSPPAGGQGGRPTRQRIDLFVRNAHRQNDSADCGPSQRHSKPRLLVGRPLSGGRAWRRNGLRVYDRDRQWTEVFRDTDYGDAIYGVTFAADGRLATASYDGKVRLYDRDFKLVVPARKATGGEQPLRIAFSPDGSMLAVGYADAATVDLFDGHSLAPLPGPNVDGLRNGNLGIVTWSKDGRTLYAGGSYSDGGVILFWLGPMRVEASGALCQPGAIQSRALRLCRTVALLVAAARPVPGVIGARRQTSLGARCRPRQTFEINDAYWRCRQTARLSISDLSYGASRRFALICARSSSVAIHRPISRRSGQSKPDLLSRDGVMGSPRPSMGSQSSYSSTSDHEAWQSIRTGVDSCLEQSGTCERSTRRVSSSGNVLCRASVWGVNISGDGRLVIAAYGDGTIRWHRMDDGRELLALFVLADKQNWVAWTPEGFYGATAGAFGVLQWQVNRGFDAAADTVPVYAIPKLRRPDALALVLQELETARALGIADMKAARRDVQIATGSTNAPGARLHVLTIGVSDYGDKARNLS